MDIKMDVARFTVTVTHGRLFLEQKYTGRFPLPYSLLCVGRFRPSTRPGLFPRAMGQRQYQFQATESKVNTDTSSSKRSGVTVCGL